MRLFVKRHGIYDVSGGDMSVELPEGSTLTDLMTALVSIDGCDLAEKSGLETMYVRGRDLIGPDSVLYDGDRITILTPLRGG